MEHIATLNGVNKQKLQLNVPENEKLSSKAERRHQNAKLRGKVKLMAQASRGRDWERRGRVEKEGGMEGERNGRRAGKRERGGRNERRYGGMKEIGSWRD